MKGDVIILMAMTGIFLVCGCNRKKECRNDMIYNVEMGDCECKDGMVYNNESKLCDCIQTHNQDNLPYLSEEQYNRWEDVVTHYEYYVKNYAEYPYYQHEGKTFKVCGWIRHYNGQNMLMASDSVYAAFDMSADSVSAFSSPYLFSTLCHIEVQPSLLESVDMDRKCYIIGTLTFDPYPAFVMVKSYPRGCCCPEFALRAMEIHN